MKKEQAATDNGRKPVLVLESNPERARVRIDGIEYELKNATEFSAVEARRIAGWGERLDELLLTTKRELTPEEEGEIPTLLDRLCKAVLDAPALVHAKLSDHQRGSIFQAFVSLEQQGRTR